MTDAAPGLAALADLLAGMTPLPRRELLCGPGVIMWLRVLAPEDDPSFPWSQSPPFTGIPLIHAPDLGRGEWELRENGEVVMCGRFRLPEPPDFTSIPLPLATGAITASAGHGALNRLALEALARRPVLVVLSAIA